MHSKGIIFDIKRFSVNDGPGIRTTVFFKGCPLSCWWCHNPESRLSDVEEFEIVHKLDEREFRKKEMIGKYLSVEDVMTEIEKETVFYETSGGGVTFSGGEPLMQPKFLMLLAETCALRNIHTCLDTSGYCNPKLFAEILPKIDFFLFDIKTLDKENHLKYTGVSNEMILTNLSTLAKSGKDYIIRLPLIPGINNDKENILKLKNCLKDLSSPIKEIHLLPYHPLAHNKYRRFGMEEKAQNITEIKEEEMNSLAHTFEQIGYNVKIGG
jgi:pyruvate formate lyase activating enzyme